MNLMVKILILSLCLIVNTQAGAKLYQYNGDLPFVEMMLSMMTEMGMIDKVPEYLINNGYSGHSRRENPLGFNTPLVYQNQYPGSAFGPQSTYPYSRKCLNEQCERNKLSNLDGVWMTQYGEILGVKEDRFLWSDGKARYLTGTFNRKINEFALKVDQNDYIMAYQFIINGNRMQTRDRNGVVRSFVRAPYKQ